MYWIGPGRRTADAGRAYAIYGIVGFGLIAFPVAVSFFSFGALTIEGLERGAGYGAILIIVMAYSAWRRNLPVAAPRTAPPPAPMPYPPGSYPPASFPQPAFPPGGYPGYANPQQGYPPPPGYPAQPYPYPPVQQPGWPQVSAPHPAAPAEPPPGVIDVTGHVVDLRPGSGQ